MTLNPLHTYVKHPCERCKGTGKLDGVRAKAGSRAAVCKRWKATCPDCLGDGHIELRVKLTESEKSPCETPGTCGKA